VDAQTTAYVEVEHRGSADVADNVRGDLEAIDKNEEFVKMTLAVMMAPE
jgi:hypothetical protein